MTCAHCRREIADYANFCWFCGAPQRVWQGDSHAPKRLMRSAVDSRIAGVCGGVAEYFEVDSTLVRLIWVLAILMPVPLVPAVLGYFVAWIVLPKAPYPVQHAAPHTDTPASAQTA